MCSASPSITTFHLVTTSGSPWSHPTARTDPSCCWNRPANPAVKPYRDALAEDGIPLAQFAVDDVEAEYDRLTKRGVSFTQTPTDIGTAVVAVFDDTGNLIQLITEKAATA